MKKMIENISTPLVLFAGSGVAGFFMGMFLRRVLKFLVIIIGSFLGSVFLVIQWMQARQYIQGQVDWNRVGNDTMEGSNHFLLKFPVRIFLGHWVFP
jgi:uncharacterized membrane protein (Fun14 family)